MVNGTSLLPHDTKNGNSQISIKFLEMMNVDTEIAMQ